MRSPSEETNPTLKPIFEKQAAAYRKLTSERAQRLGLEPRLSKTKSNSDGGLSPVYCPRYNFQMMWGAVYDGV
jgi:hypothetical protein